MKAFSMDLRERVIAAIEVGDESQASIAVTFGVALRTVENWWRRWRETRSVAARAHAGGQAQALEGCEALLRDALKKQPDATLDELCQRVREAKAVTVSRSMMCREMRRLKLPRKKRRRTTANGTPRA
jgi:transposase